MDCIEKGGVLPELLIKDRGGGRRAEHPSPQDSGERLIGRVVTTRTTAPLNPGVGTVVVIGLSFLSDGEH